MQLKYRRLKRRKNKNIMINTIVVMALSTLLLATGYSAFQTVISINTKGAIKQIDFYVSSTGSDIEGDGTKSNPYQTIQKAYNVAPKKAKIYIMDDISILSTITFGGDKSVLLTSYSENDTPNSIIRSNSLKNQMIDNVLGELTLNNIVIDGKNIESDQPMLFMRKGTLTLEKDTLLQNGVSLASGGAIWINTNGKLIINGGSINNNRTTYNGGAINNSGILQINGGVIKNNLSQSDGGAIMNEGSIELNKGIISDNVANSTGGAIYNKSNIIINNIDMYNNSADLSGGGIYCINGNIKMINGSIHNNKALNNTGSAIALVGSTLEMTGGTISDNEVFAGGYTGAVSLYNGSTFILNGGVIKNNKGYPIHNISSEGENTYVYKSGIICSNENSSDYDTQTICTE